MSNQNINWLGLAIILLIHTLFLTLPPVNQEFAFVGATQFFHTNDSGLLEQFFTYQANTLALPYFVYLFSKVIPQVDILYLYRIINLIGLILLTVGIHRLCRFTQNEHQNKIFLLVMLNPLVWTFAERATADFMPAALGIYAISIALGNPKKFHIAIISGLLFGVACIFKYHTLSLLVLLSALLWITEQRESIRKVITISILALSIVIAYALIIHHHYGFWLTPNKYQRIHHIQITGIANNFILYTGFIGLIALPTFFMSSDYLKALYKFRNMLFLALLFILTLALFVVSDSGELNLGPIDAYLNKELRMIILSLMSLATLTLAISLKNEEQGKLKVLIGIGILITLSVFSSSRPAQRYLIFFIPFFLLFIPKSIYKSKPVYNLAIALFILGISFMELNRYATGMAAKLMVKALENQHMLAVTAPGDIDSHVGNYFFKSRNIQKKFTIVLGKDYNAEFTVSAGLGFYKKYFSVIKIDSENKSNT